MKWKELQRQHTAAVNKDVLSASYAPGAAVGCRGTGMNQTSLCSQGIYVLKETRRDADRKVTSVSNIEWWYVLRKIKPRKEIESAVFYRVFREGLSE